jgi:hypothetical protein
VQVHGIGPWGITFVNPADDLRQRTGSGREPPSPAEMHAGHKRRERMGIRLRRDSWVSVRYAEGLNSSQSSVTHQRTDRHGILG